MNDFTDEAKRRGRPTLNTDGLEPWAVVPIRIKRRRQVEHKHYSPLSVY